MKHVINRKAMLGIGALGLLAATLFSGTALAHDRDDYRYGNHNWNNNRIQNSRYNYRYRPVVKTTWVRPGRVAYLPGNRWGYYKNHPAPRRSWW